MKRLLKKWKGSDKVGILKGGDKMKKKKKKKKAYPLIGQAKNGKKKNTPYSVKNFSFHLVIRTLANIISDIF